MAAHVRPGWHRLALVGVAAGVVAGGTLILGGAGAPRTAQAAPAAAEVTCPAQLDPATISLASDGFAKIDGIAGDATDARHAGEVNLVAVRGGVIGDSAALCDAAGGTAGGGAGKATFEPIVVEKRVDRASVPLAAKAITGAHIATVRITLQSTGAQPVAFLTYDLTNVRVVSMRQVKQGNTLEEQVVFGFTRIAYTFVPQDAKGAPGAAITFCFDLAANQAC